MNKLKCAFAVIALLITQSCTSVVDPEDEKLNLEITWLTEKPIIRPVSAKNKFVYCSVRNSSGSDLKLENHIHKALTSLGYQLTDDLEIAHYTLLTDISYHGLKKEEGYSGLLIGGGTGAVIGSVAGHQVDPDKGKYIGAGLGAIIGGIAGMMVDEKNALKVIDVVVDLRIGEKVNTGVKTRTKSNSNRNLNGALSKANGSGVHAGSSNNVTSEESSFVRNDDFFYHSARLVCSAKKIGLTKEDAQEELTKKLTNSLSQTLP
jgi:gas vesicle protein